MEITFEKAGMVLVVTLKGRLDATHQNLMRDKVDPKSNRVSLNNWFFAILSGYSMESVEFHRVSVGSEKDKGNREVFNLELKNSGREWAGIESKRGSLFYTGCMIGMVCRMQLAAIVLLTDRSLI